MEDRVPPVSILTLLQEALPLLTQSGMAVIWIYALPYSCRDALWLPCKAGSFISRTQVSRGYPFVVLHSTAFLAGAFGRLSFRGPALPEMSFFCPYTRMVVFQVQNSRSKCVYLWVWWALFKAASVADGPRSHSTDTLCLFLSENVHDPSNSLEHVLLTVLALMGPLT